LACHGPAALFNSRRCTAADSRLLGEPERASLVSSIGRAFPARFAAGGEPRPKRSHRLQRRRPTRRGSAVVFSPNLNLVSPAGVSLGSISVSGLASEAEFADWSPVP
jgi:hypothetical protein